MSPIDRRHFLLGAGLCMASGIAFARQPRATSPVIEKDAFDDLVPENFGDWRYQTASGLVLPPPDQLSDRLYDNLLTRVYRGPGGAGIMLLIAYSNVQDGMLQVHRPEVCYPAGGYSLSPTRQTMLGARQDDRFPVNLFSATSYDRNEQVLYWTRIGSEFPLSWSAQRLAVIRANLTGVIPDGILVRVSTVAPDMADARPVLEGFTIQLLGAMQPAGRTLMIGDRS